MIRLTSVNRKLQCILAGAVTTNQLPITVCYTDATTTSWLGGTTVINTNSTTAVDICAAPTASTVRDIDYISVRNSDTVPATVTIRYNDNATLYTLFTATLSVGDILIYVHGSGVHVLDSSGSVKSTVTFAGLVIAAGKTETFLKTMSFTAADDTGVYTFPTGTASLARIDAAQTFAGVQTLTSAPALQNGSISGSGSLLLGADITATTITNATRKSGVLSAPHYTNAEEKVLAMWVDSDTTANNIYIGGGLGGFNAATFFGVYVGATSTTTSGTLTFGVYGSGQVAVFGPLSVSGNASYGGIAVSSRTLTGTFSTHANEDQSTLNAGSAGQSYGTWDSKAQILAASAQPYDHIAGFQARMLHNGSGLLSYWYGFLTEPVIAASASVTNIYGYQVRDAAGTGTVTKQSGVRIEDLTRGTSNYGVESVISSGTGKWNIYASGTAQNAFAGNVRVGSTTAPTVALDVTGAALISTTLGVTGAVTGAAITASGILSTTDATDATSATAASLKTAGGIASVKSAWIGDKLTVVTSVSTPSIITASGALGITPAAGSGVNINLSTTGDFAVNTSQFYVDTSQGVVGIGTATPDLSYKLTISGNTAAVGPAILFKDTAASPIDYLMGPDGSHNFIFRDHTAAVNRLTISGSTGAVSAAGALSSGGILSTTDATDASSATAASLKTAGGIAAVKGLWIGGASRLAGTTTVDGALTSSFDTVAATGSINIVAAGPSIRLKASGGTADKNTYDLRVAAAGAPNDFFELRKINDATSVFTSLLTVSEAGAVTVPGTLGVTGTAATGALTVTGAASATTTYTSGAPNTGTAAPWKFGSLVGGQIGLVVIATQYVEIDISGTLYKLATV